MHKGKIVILYFSATSNTKLIVDKCSRTFNEEGYLTEIIKVEDLDKVKNIDFDEIDLFGIAYPCYAFDFPKEVMKAALNLIQKQDKNIPTFIINTYCINSGLSIKSMEKILKDKNFDIILARGFKCPSPGFVSITSKESTARFKYNILRKLMIFEENILIKASNYGKEVIKSLEAYNKATFQVTIKVRKISYFGIKFAKRNEKKIFNNYKINKEKCVSCAVCVKQCPVNNMQIVDEKVDFIDKNNCLRCMKCISNCPKDAITLGDKTRGMDRYNKKMREKVLVDRM